ncbi:Uncharacterized protein HZ326_9923 [Fusarium oxysporum f. sp. albedinis]|nr:Uncharacterized protein HZ326_9923 [Fusarium oxysporum f. sp. albedinis]
MFILNLCFSHCVVLRPDPIFKKATVVTAFQSTSLKRNESVKSYRKREPWTTRISAFSNKTGPSLTLRLITPRESFCESETGSTTNNKHSSKSALGLASCCMSEISSMPCDKDLNLGSITKVQKAASAVTSVGCTSSHPCYPVSKGAHILAHPGSPLSINTIRIDKSLNIVSVRGVTSVAMTPSFHDVSYQHPVDDVSAVLGIMEFMSRAKRPCEITSHSRIHVWSLTAQYCSCNHLHYHRDSKPGAPVHPGQPSNCIAWHTVRQGDDCETVPRRYYITKKEFLAWNPTVSKDCLTNFWLKYAYCVRVDVANTQSTKESITSTTKMPSTEDLSSTITSASGIISKSIATTSANTTYSVLNPVSTWNITTPTTDVTWPPKATQSGQPKDRNKWHLVHGRQSCRDVLSTHSSFMKKEDFFKWNPEVHQDCSGLFVGYRFCVGVKSNSTGNLEWETSTPPFTPPPEPTTHKPTKLTPSGSNFTPTPTHGPMPTDCVNYHQAEADESCRDILKTYNYLSKDQFFKYNPVLEKNCDGLWRGNWYCIGVKSELPMPPTVTTTPSDVPRGSPKDCKAWYYTTGGETCEQLANMFATFNIKGLIAMNPSVLDDCGDIEDNTWYCVAGPDTPTTRTADVTASTRPATAMPTQSGIATGCERYWLVSKKDTCKSIRRANSISLEKLLTWNPALGSTCSGLKPDSYVCVNVGA